jgi:hypothetical protein
MSFKQIAQSLEPFMDPSGDVYVTVEVEGKPSPEIVPLESRQGRAVLRTRLCDYLSKGYATDHEMRSAVEVVYGHAFERERQIADTAWEYLIAQKPLAEAVLAIAGSGGTESTPSQLLAKVNTVASRQGIDTKRGPWPHSEDSLGRQLSQLVPLLASAGIRVDRRRGNQRQWTIHPPESTSDGCDGEVADTSVDHASDSGEPDTRHASHSHVIPLPASKIDDDELKALCRGATS